MYRHGATGLAGPVSKARVWWHTPAVESDTDDLTMVLAPSAETVPVEEIRTDLVARVRREIADGTYDTPDKWETALARMVNRCG